MVLTASTMMALGKKAPDFNLPDTVTSANIDLSKIDAYKGYVIIFMCNHCPYVKYILPELTQFTREFTQRGIKFIGINSNDVNNYPDDAPDKMKQLADDLEFCFPYCYDESQQVARSYDAACTPDFFVFDSKKLCFYRGQFDSSRPGNDKPINGKDLRKALEAILEGRPWHGDQKPSMGCSIKWKD